MELSITAKVWNRAALESGGEAPVERDRAFAALLAVHGMAMNRGLEHALEVLDVHEWVAGIVGFRYLGLTEAVSVLGAATSAEIGLELLNSKAVHSSLKMQISSRLSRSTLRCRMCSHSCRPSMPDKRIESARSGRRTCKSRRLLRVVHSRR